MESLLSLLVYLLVGAIVIYAVYLILSMIKIRYEIKMIVYVIVALVFLLWLLRTLGIFVF